jgi:hypothetical protein
MYLARTFDGPAVLAGIFLAEWSQPTFFTSQGIRWSGPFFRPHGAVLNRLHAQLNGGYASIAFTAG